ncbi:DUF1007 family protein [Bradyrhizobium sp. BRP22]|nr:DUF1007 family protein [Bradyrhizobium sp. BRP22]
MSPSAAASPSRTRCSAGVACLRRPRPPDVRALSRWLGLMAIALMLGVTAAEAHPHVWITARSELIYAPDGTITGVRHAWTFDDMFSTYALQGIEAKTKGAYTREELAPLAQTNVESLKEFAYFTFAKADGKKQKFAEPVDYFLEYKNTELTLHFTLPAKTPFKARQLALEVFDPAFFIDFKYADKDPIKLVGAPADCKMQFQRPNDGTASAQQLGEQNFLNGESSNFGAMFANKIVVECP